MALYQKTIKGKTIFETYKTYRVTNTVPYKIQIGYRFLEVGASGNFDLSRKQYEALSKIVTVVETTNSTVFRPIDTRYDTTKVASEATYPDGFILTPDNYKTYYKPFNLYVPTEGCLYVLDSKYKLQIFNFKAGQFVLPIQVTKVFKDGTTIKNLIAFGIEPPTDDTVRVVSTRSLNLTINPMLALLNTGYSYTPSVSGGGSNKIFSLTSILPNGLNLNSSTGSITGTPSKLAKQNLNMGVTDGTATVNVDFNINVSSTGILQNVWSAEVWNLLNTSSTGPAIGTAIKVPGVDTLPTGASYNAGSKLVTISSTNVSLDGWDFRNTSVLVNANGFTISNCRFNNTSGPIYYINIGRDVVVTSGRITQCLLDGEKSTTGSYSTAIWINTNGSGGIEIDHCRFKELPTDCITTNGPTDLGDSPANLIHHNYFTIGAFGSPLAHYDALTFNGGYNKFYKNLVDMTPETDTYGTNNCLRIFGFQKNKVEIYNNIFAGHETLGSYPIQIGGTYMFYVKIYDNLVSFNNGGSWYYPGPTNVVQSSGNKSLITGVAVTEMPVVSDVVGPTITSSASQSITEGLTLSLTLTSSEAVDWSISGPDVAKFTLNRSTLSFIAPSFSSPTDANGDNTYSIVITAKDGLGNATNQNFTVPVTSANVDPAVAYFQRLSDVGSPADTTRQSAYTILFNSLKNGSASGSNILTKLDALYVAAHSLTAFRQNLIANQYNTTPVGSSYTYTVDRGFVGFSGTHYLDTGFNPATATNPKFTQANTSLGVLTRTLGGINDGYIGQSTQCQLASGSATAATVSARLNTTAALTTTGNFLPGFVNLNRTAGNTAFTVSNGTTRESLSRGAATPNSTTLNIGKGATVNSAGGQVSAAWFGGSLTLTEESDLKNALTTYLQAIGAL